jgi:putative component of membrane protein insertase Oxa1/YidC/SpoIIIJ protein YidD
MSLLRDSWASVIFVKPFLAALPVLFFLLVCSGSAVLASPEKMRGPDAKPFRNAEVRDPETSVTRLFFLGAVSGFQRYISPTDGDRCGFTPTCSAFGRDAVERRGPFLGVLVTADRLMRCTLFKRPGPDYLLLPDGKLFDPVENNLLSTQ